MESFYGSDVSKMVERRALFINTMSEECRNLEIDVCVDNFCEKLMICENHEDFIPKKNNGFFFMFVFILVKCFRSVYGYDKDYCVLMGEFSNCREVFLVVCRELKKILLVLKNIEEKKHEREILVEETKDNNIDESGDRLCVEKYLLENGENETKISCHISKDESGEFSMFLYLCENWLKSIDDDDQKRSFLYIRENKEYGVNLENVYVGGIKKDMSLTKVNSLIKRGGILLSVYYVIKEAFIGLKFNDLSNVKVGSVDITVLMISHTKLVSVKIPMINDTDIFGSMLRRNTKVMFQFGFGDVEISKLKENDYCEMPVRGKHCEHYSCFSFSNQFTETLASMSKINGCVSLKCPLCDKNVHLDELYVSKSMIDLGSSIHQKTKGKSKLFPGLLMSSNHPFYTLSGSGFSVEFNSVSGTSYLSQITTTE